MSSRIKRYVSVLLWLSPALLVAQGLPPNSVTGSASFSLMSHYLWRGQKLSEKMVFQPTVEVGYRGFGAALWTNNDLVLSETTETDYTLYYGGSSGNVELSVGYINYAFDGFADTQEFYATVGLAGILSPSLGFYYDFDEGDGGFLSFSLGHSVALSDAIDLEFGGLASANLGNAILGVGAAGKTFSGFYNAELGASLSVPVATAISLSPRVAYSFALSNNAKTAISAISFDGKSNTLYGGLAADVAF